MSGGSPIGEKKKEEGRRKMEERSKSASALLKVKACFAILLVFAPLLTNLAEASASELTLQGAFQKALKRSESVAITAEEINQAQARFYRSFDYFLPSVHFEMTHFRQDVDAESSGGTLDTGRRTKPEKKFTVSQPLFSGFREIAALQSRGADKKQQVMAWKRAKELLFVDVMESFYTVLQAQKDVEVLLSTHTVLDRRMKDLEERVRLGRSRESEMKTSLSDLKLIEADLVEARAQVRIARNLLSYYTGESLEGIDLQEEDEVTDWPEISGVLDQWKMRADVMSNEQAYIVAQKGVIGAQANLFPIVSLEGNYYTQRVGFQSGNDWDVTFKIDAPVFEIGQTLGDIKEAVSDREKARLTYEQTKRLASLDIQNSYEDLKSSKESEEALAVAHRASKENYDLLAKEYLLNLVNNLEVLDALRRHEDIEKRYHEARYNMGKNYWKLRVAMGDVPGVNTKETAR
jgi:outer membrane protein TolC